MTTLAGPLCDAGRCARLLEAFAEAQRRWERSSGEQLWVVLAGVLRALGHDPESPEVRELVAAQIGALVGDPKVIEGRAA